MPGHSTRVIKISFDSLGLSERGCLLIVSTHEQRLGRYRVYWDYSHAYDPIIPTNAVLICDALEDYPPWQAATQKVATTMIFPPWQEKTMGMTKRMNNAMETVEILKKIMCRDYQLIEICGNYDGGMDIWRQFPHYAVDECDHYRLFNAGADPNLFYKGRQEDYKFEGHEKLDGYELHVKSKKPMDEKTPMDCEPTIPMKCYL